MSSDQARGRSVGLVRPDDAVERRAVAAKRAGGSRRRRGRQVAMRKSGNGEIERKRGLAGGRGGV